MSSLPTPSTSSHREPSSSRSVEATPSSPLPAASTDAIDEDWFASEGSDEAAAAPSTLSTTQAPALAGAPAPKPLSTIPSPPADDDPRTTIDWSMGTHWTGDSASAVATTPEVPAAIRRAEPPEPEPLAVALFSCDSAQPAAPEPGRPRIATLPGVGSTEPPREEQVPSSANSNSDSTAPAARPPVFGGSGDAPAESEPIHSLAPVAQHDPPELPYAYGFAAARGRPIALYAAVVTGVVAMGLWLSTRAPTAPAGSALQHGDKRLSGAAAVSAVATAPSGASAGAPAPSAAGPAGLASAEHGAVVDPPKVAEAAAGPSASASAPSTMDSASPSTEGVSVRLRFMPKGVKIYYKGKAIGKSTVTVQVPSGESPAYDAFMPGYMPRHVVVDGSQPDILLWMVPAPAKKDAPSDN